ncbi:hypothetical protein DFP72DRAFT_1074064 [Ephemerocybe angulata]|uniref:MYND-type domain-containing protein n=1 Tax=Ephemerocybe angulata TaxID=980116 RepID=A0A8H6HLP8_9AGAR|nr:hypothetical protein DFP72DRAFT_1074064 [Tulosesus angulatus]
MLEETPTDLWVEIAALLHPLDLLSLQSTCRALNQVLSQKHVWIAALRRTCREHSIFPPSYPTDEMDTGQVVRAALGPYRFQKLVDDNATFAGHADDAPDLFPERGPFPSSHGVPLARPGKSHLLSGGRFYLTFDCKSLVVWDLGFVGKQSGNGIEVREAAQLDFKPDTFKSNSQGCFSVSQVGEDTLRVVVAGGVDKVTMKAFDIGPFVGDLAHLAFRQLGSLNINLSQVSPAHTKQVIIDGDRVIFQPVGGAGRKVIVWDLGLSMYAGIVVENSSPAMPWDLDKMFVHGAIIEFRATDLRIWDVTPDYVQTFGLPVAADIPIPFTTVGRPLGPAHYKVVHYPQADTKSRYTVVANRHQGHLPIVFDLYPNYRAADYTGFTRYTLDITRNPLHELVGSVTCVAKKAFPVGYSFLGMQSDTSLFAPSGFSAQILKAGERPAMEHFEPGMKVHEFLYSAKGLNVVRNQCSNPGCRKRERTAGIYKVCAACHLVTYCGPACQKVHWAMHKALCKKQKVGLASQPEYRTLPPMRLLKVLSIPPVQGNYNLGMCAASGRMLAVMHNHKSKAEYSGVLYISDFLK